MHRENSIIEIDRTQWLAIRRSLLLKCASRHSVLYNWAFAAGRLRSRRHGCLALGWSAALQA